MFGRLAWQGAIVLLAAACAAPTSTPPPMGSQAPQPAPMPAPTQPPTQSALSYGMVTSQVRTGETTQLELVQLFGSPNISSFDSDGVETWVYDKSVTQTDVQSRSQAAQGAANLGVFFSSTGGGVGATTAQSSQTGTATTSVRSITVIIKFAPNKTVSDYKVRASYF